MDKRVTADTDIKLAQHEIELGIALQRLLANKDFQLVITNGYLKDELLATTLDATSLTDKESKLIRNERIDAIAYFNMYLSNIEYNADTAPLRLTEAMTTRESEEYV